MSRRKLAGHRVVVTGASSGIGQELAVQLAALGCRLIINARRVDRLQTLVDSIRRTGGDVEPVPGDITEPATREAILARALDCWKGLDILINNAGIGAIGPFAEADDRRLRRVMDVNFFAPCALTRSAIPLLAEGEQPLIVNISSVLAHRGVPLKSEYCASKFALHGWSDALRAELTDQGIDVLLVSPATTDSEFFDNVIENTTRRDWKLSSARSPATVARQAIRGMQRGRHEVFTSWGGRGLVWLDRIFPGLANRVVARFGK